MCTSYQKCLEHYFYQYCFADCEGDNPTTYAARCTTYCDNLKTDCDGACTAGDQQCLNQCDMERTNCDRKCQCELRQKCPDQFTGVPPQSFDLCNLTFLKFGLPVVYEHQVENETCLFVKNQVLQNCIQDKVKKGDLSIMDYEMHREECKLQLCAEGRDSCDGFYIDYFLDNQETATCPLLAVTRDAGQACPADCTTVDDFDNVIPLCDAGSESLDYSTQCQQTDTQERFVCYTSTAIRRK